MLNVPIQKVASTVPVFLAILEMESTVVSERSKTPAFYLSHIPLHIIFTLEIWDEPTSTAKICQKLLKR